MKKILVVFCVLIIMLSIGTTAKANLSPDPKVLAAFDTLQSYIVGLPKEVLSKGQKDSLSSMLKNAKKNYQLGQPCDAAGILNAYLNATQALSRGKRLEIAEDLYNRGWTLLYDLLTSLPEGTCPEYTGFGIESKADVVESDNKHLKGIMSFEQPRMMTVEANGEQFTQLHMSGIDPIGEPGLPGVPVIRRLIAVPWGAEVSVMVNPQVRKIINNINLYPYQMPARDQNDEPPPPEYFADPPFTKNEGVYARDALIPADVVTVTPIGLFRDVQMAQVEVTTAQYNPFSKTLILYEAVEFNVSFNGGTGNFVTDASINPFEVEARTLLSEAVLNRIDVYAYVGPRIEHIWPRVRIGSEMLIFTHPNFRTAADDLAKHRRDHGISTSVVEVNDGTGPGPDTNADIDNFIEDRYEDCRIRPSYILLMGDSEYIPTFSANTAGDYGLGTATDYPYAALGRCTSCHRGAVPPPSFAVGRISVDTLAEAQTIVDKIKAYELHPPTNSSFYDNISIASQFQCCRMDSLGNSLSGNDGTDQRAFIETSEFVRDALLTERYTVERIYTETVDAPYNGNTTPVSYYNGTLLPTALSSASGFAWSGTTQDIINAFNNGRFLVFHRDHGWSVGWVNPGFTNTNVTNNLTNGNLTPVVFSVNCSSGRFDDNESFAETLLRKNNGGAVGVIGDTRDSGTWVNNALSRGLFDAVWPNTVAGFGTTASIRRLGDILNHAKLYVINQVGVTQTAGSFSQGIAEDELFLFHAFGDPAMTMWTSSPGLLLREYSFEEFVERLRLIYGEEGAVITALQNGTPIARAPVVGGEANLEFFVQPNPNEPIELSASKENFISVKLHTCYADLPSPNLIITGSEDDIGPDGSEYTRYNLEVTNSGDFPNELFEPSPHLPPCGSNTNSSRTWVYIYDNEDNSLLGSCGFSSSDDLNNLWFGVLKGTAPPASVYIQMVDRECETTYTSNPVSIPVDPTITITQPTTDDVYNPPGTSDPLTINLSGTASDDGEIVGVTWSNNRGGSGTATGTTNWSITDIPLFCGNDNIITVTAEDSEGNTGSDILTVNVAPCPPPVIITFPVVLQDPDVCIPKT